MPNRVVGLCSKCLGVMVLHRFFTEQPFADKLIVTDDDAHHIKNVLRLKVGDKVQLLTVDNYLCQAQIAAFINDTVQLDVTICEKIAENSGCKVILAQGLAKGEKMDWVMQKAVELGATDIVPLALEHCVVSYDESKAAKKVARWQKIAAEAAKQSKQNYMPTVHAVMNLEEFLVFNTANLSIIAYEQEKHTTLKHILQNSDLAQSIAFIVGAEGGLSSKEVKNAKEYGFIPVSLGKEILRTETAPIMLLSALRYEKG